MHTGQVAVMIHVVSQIVCEGDTDVLNVAIFTDVFITIHCIHSAIFCSRSSVDKKTGVPSLIKSND